jgi:hypothetical protein
MSIPKQMYIFYQNESRDQKCDPWREKQST